jgi:hypothetical protein
MIELPHEYLNAIFAAVIIVANVRRSSSRLGGSPDAFDKSEGQAATKCDQHQCESAWNKDPVFGVIGIQSGPRG